MARYTHLTLNDRIAIQQGLSEKKSLRKIAESIGRDVSTISKEVKKHRQTVKTGGFGQAFNDCKHKKQCQKRKYCRIGTSCNLRCNGCGHCIGKCDRYEKTHCETLSKSPYVCNGCSIKQRCTLEKSYYSASKADEAYRKTLSESRTGLFISAEELKAVDAIVTPLIEQGHSIHHICMSNKSEIMLSGRTIYNYIDKGVLSAKNIDLPRKVRFRARRSTTGRAKIERSCRAGRTYEDFKVFMDEKPDTAVVQADSVEGNKGGKVLLTLHFVKAEFMLAFLRDRNTAASVNKVFDDLYELLGEESFERLFPVILADNGSEFSNPSAIEVDSDGVIRTKLFYCDPSSPYQKGSAENNHGFIRRIIPKGKSMNELTQEKVNLMMNHINSYKRKNLGGKNPCEVFRFFYGQDILDKLGIAEIPANDILLKPELLK